MAPSCAVLGCTKKFNKLSNPSITFHRFPKDDVMRNEWVRALGRENFTPTIYSRLCSKHFTEEDFYRTTLKVYLHSQAVPSVFEASPEHLQRQEAENVFQLLPELFYSSGLSAVPQTSFSPSKRREPASSLGEEASSSYVTFFLFH
ncbi:THAP domain-containing protein 2-like [Palaemon carinicauda]|uniref:THAP domain-containing protein 2-like n=1 Tax=Palaemon carinicauda TaxID=392227 RepID=UPI0035B67A55